MTLDEAQQIQKKIFDTATRLLTEKNINDILSKLGSVKFVGSYAAKLMVKPDIDFEIVNPDITADMVVELASSFFKMKDNYSVEIADGTDYVRRPGHPKGYFIGVNIMFEKTIWHLDVWLTNKPIDTSGSDYISLSTQDWYKTVSQEKLDTILLLKHQLVKKKEYAKYASANVYESVLSGNVTSLQEFYEWAKTHDTEAQFRRGESRST